jgi:acetylglutamate kinase
MIRVPNPWVLKVGGRELRPGEALEQFADVVARAVHAGVPTVVVHGGGEEITERADALGLPTERVRGQRVTDAAMLEVVIEVLGGRINHRLVAAIQRAGVPAFGLSGTSGRLLTAEPMGDPPGSLGYVGRPTAVRARILRTLFESGWTPVIAPLGSGPGGSVYNVNADLAAAALAGSLSGDLALLTDVPGVRDRAGAVLPSLSLDQIPGLLSDGTATGGMIPKLEAASTALTEGALSVWIGDLPGLSHPGSPAVGTRFVGRKSSAPTLPLLPSGGT